MTDPNHSGSFATSERLRSSVADDLPVQPSGMPSPSSVGSVARPSESEPTATSEPIPNDYLPAASPLPNQRPEEGRRLTAAHWITLAVLALIVLAVAAGSVKSWSP
jgi:hypothetical protein